MSIKRTLLALGVLAAVMLVGCKQPVGLPNNRVYAATLDTVVCLVNYQSNLTGSVLHYVDGQTPGGWYDRESPFIKWGYTQVNGYPYPEQYGFAVFDVPEFNSPNGLPVCTLFYYVQSYSGSVNLLINEIDPPMWTWTDPALFQAIDTSSDTLVKDDPVTSTGWHKVALTDQGRGILGTVGSNGGDDDFYTGWKYMDTPQSGSYTRIYGADDALSPYIVVIYEPGP